MNTLTKLLTGFAIASSFISFSQEKASHKHIDMSNVREGESVEYCTQHKKMMELLQNPAQLKIYQADQAQLAQVEQNMLQQKQQGVVYTIPVVFHVLHDNGVENISRAQILSALDILNRDFRLLNADANNVIAQFQGMPSDVEIEFALATKAPNGTCFSGITRTKNALTHDGSNGNAQVTAIINGNDVYNGQWPGDEYLNIFICEEIGGAAGYTFNPISGFGNSMYAGIWVLQNYVGAIGTSSTFTSRTLTHEVGHWLNLSHTWGPNNNPGNASSCGDDDGVSDTPNTIGVTSCNLTENTCGSVANVENYMDYSYCSKMFTPGQTARMRASLNSSVGGRNNLWTSGNLAATGATGTPSFCAADFYSDKVTVCGGDDVTFYDNSYNGSISGWTWTFAGGTPSSSSLQNPVINYSTPGTYSVTLTATDGSTNKTKTKTNLITVLEGGRPAEIVEGFENISIPNAEWYMNNTNSTGFTITTTASASGSKSLRLNNNTNTAGDVDEFISTNIDLSAVSDVRLTFKYAFAKKASTNTDRLQIYVSKNCGETWSHKKNLSGSNLPTAPNHTGSFIPEDNEWKEITISNISSSFLAENFRVKFKFTAGGGNKLYIDDINIFDLTTVSISENEFISDLKLYPNPTQGNSNIEFSLNQTTDADILLTDMVGKIVEVISSNTLNAGTHKFVVNTNALRAGIYFVNLSIGDQMITQKLIVR